MFPKNKAVGHLEIDFLLDCNHVGVEEIEAVIFAPSIGEERYCATCHTKKKIQQIGKAYWVDQDEQEPEKK